MVGLSGAEQRSAHTGRRSHSLTTTPLATLQFGDDWAILPQGYATLLEGLDPQRLNIKFDSPVVRVSSALQHVLSLPKP